jgi:hypothetical protein
MKTIFRATAALGAALALAGLAACDRGNDGAPSATPAASEQTINVKPAPPTGDPPGTTPVTGNESDLTKQQSNSQMPLEGQNHNYSSVAPTQSQKAGDGHAPSEGDNARPDPEQHGNQQPDTQRSK